MVVRIRNIEDTSVIIDAKGMLKTHVLFAHPILVTELEEAFAYNRVDRPLWARTNRSDCARFAIGYEQVGHIARDATGLGHSGLQTWCVDNILSTTASVGFEVARGQVHDPYLV